MTIDEYAAQRGLELSDDERAALDAKCWEMLKRPDLERVGFGTDLSGSALW